MVIGIDLLLHLRHLFFLGADGSYMIVLGLHIHLLRCSFHAAFALALGRRTRCGTCFLFGLYYGGALVRLSI